MSDSTFHTTKEDLRKAESQVSKKNDGNVPSDSEPSQMKVCDPPPPSNLWTMLTCFHSPLSTKTPSPNPRSLQSVKQTFLSLTSLPWPQTGIRVMPARSMSAPVVYRAMYLTVEEATPYVGLQLVIVV